MTGSHLQRDINHKYIITVRNKVDTLQETSERHNSKNKYENFVTVHMKAAAAECIPIKPRAKSRIPW